MEGAWIERALTLSDLWMQIWLGKCVDVLQPVAQQWFMLKKHDKWIRIIVGRFQISYFYFSFYHFFSIISPSLGTCPQKHTHTAPTGRISCCAENYYQSYKPWILAFSFNISFFTFLFIYFSILELRVRVRVTISHCHISVTLDDTVTSHET